MEKFIEIQNTTLKSLSEESLINSLVSLKSNSNTEVSALGGSTPFGMTAPCPASQFMLIREKGDDGLFDHYKIFCKTYSCQFCGPKKVFLVQKAFEKAIIEKQLRVFATLTLDPKKCTRDESPKYIRKCWNTLRVLQRREFNRNVDFISVIEPTPSNGYAHLHVLLNEYTPHAWLKEKWVAVGGGIIVDVREADLRAARYLAKYMRKQLFNRGNFTKRLFSTSRSINLRKLLARPESLAQFDFAQISENDARYILQPFIESDILDQKNYIRGFKSSRRLNV